MPYSYGIENPWRFTNPSTSTTKHPFHDMGQYEQSTMPIHQVYQNHDFSAIFTTTTTPRTPPPPPLMTRVSSTDYYNTKSHFPYQSYHPNQFADRRQTSYSSNNPQFPYMTELMKEIARVDHFPSSTPRSSPGLTALPTFQTPGPPYAEVDEVQPLSYLPPPNPEPATPTRRSFTARPRPPPQQQQYSQQPTVRVNLDKPIYVLPPNYINQGSSQQKQSEMLPYFNYKQQHHGPTRRNQMHQPPPNYRRPPMKPPQYHYNRQFFMPRPKQYRLTLKGGVREAAVKMDDVVPRFVSKIAHEFFKKPEIYVPKIRPGKPLTLEKVVLNHKEIIPKEVVFHPGALPTKLRFTPNAQWEMKSEMAKQGIMLNEPLTPIQDYVKNDPNVMEMDAPFHAVQTYETHTNMNMGHYPEYTSGGGTNLNINIGVNPNQIHKDQQQEQQQEQSQSQYPILLPSPAPSQHFSLLSLDHQHQQELQHQLLLAQHHQQQAFAGMGVKSPMASGSSTLDSGFTIDPADFNDFKLGNANGEHLYPKELQIPGVQQVVVDKFIVHDPLSPSGTPMVFSTTTVQPSTMDNSMINNQRRTDLGLMSHINYGGIAGVPSPTPPSVLVRHHGAPSTTPSPPRVQTGSNFLITVINSTPSPLLSTTVVPQVQHQMPPIQFSEPVSSGSSSSIVSQIQDYLADQMDFGAKPESDLFDMLFHSRTGMVDEEEAPPVVKEQSESAGDKEDDIDQQANESKIPGEVDTDRVANIFSMDFTSKNGNGKKPEVIVIKVPPNHSDGPFPKVIEKRGGEEIEIHGGNYNTASNSKNSTVVNKNVANSTEDGVESSTENSIITSTSKSVETNESSSEGDSRSKEIEFSSKRRRKKNKRRRRKKKKNRNKDERVDDDKDEQKATEKTNDDSDIKIVSEDNSNGGLVNKTTQNESKNDAEQKFQSELDWKSQLMANICELNPSSPLCLTYRSICLLMTSDDS